MALWFNKKVEGWNCQRFNTVIETSKNYSDRILNFFENSITNAVAESFDFIFIE